jgi:hypothetical protein
VILAAATLLVPWGAIPSARSGSGQGPQDVPGLPLPAEGARDATDAGYAFAEARTERTTYFAGEPIHVALRFGFDEEFLRTNLVPLFRPPMDVPVQWEVPWIDRLPGAEARRRGERPLEGKSFVLNEGLARAQELEEPRVDGRRFRVFELRRTYFATAAGELVLPGSRLRFAFATRFGERAFDENAAQDRVEAFVVAPARTLRILALPEESRPADFTGAVGRLALRTELAAAEVELGASVRLSLHVAGDGNLEFFAAPELVADDGWRMLGRIDHPGDGERTIEYDLAPRRPGATRVPQVAFSYFDTTPPASYRTLLSEALPITVRGAEPGGPQVPAGGGNGEPAERRPWGAIAAGAAAGLVAGWFVLRRLRSRRAG